ncbi:MAG: cytidylate kinase-like family protein [Clostridia bacterium]|nr:cytidylate kinase-like family protein [Clostridia bacterium]
MGRVITVGRQFGSGGRELGRRLAEELSIEYYDKEIVTEISKHTSLSEDYVRQVIDHKPHNLYPITVGHSLTYIDDYAIRRFQSVFAAQDEIIKELAGKSDCVIVGRCADYILQDIKPYRIFVHADLDSRVNRCLAKQKEDEHLNAKQMRKKILNIDKNRAKYYEYYTGNKWGVKENYDLCVNTTDTVIKEFVPVIAKMFK